MDGAEVTLNSDKQYVAPAWADGSGAGSIGLDVIKAGVLVERVPAFPSGTASFALLGRQEDACHIHLAHESCSRIHAALQLGAAQTVYIADLGATHGTFVNKQRLPAYRYTRIQDGALLSFGASTRTYVLTAPSDAASGDAEAESEAHRQLRVASEARQERKAAQRAAAAVERASGATWGMRDDSAALEAEQQRGGDSEEEEDGAADGVALARRLLRALEALDDVVTHHNEALSEKDRQALDRTSSRRVKVSSLCEAVDRIRAKATGGDSSTMRRRPRGHDADLNPDTDGLTPGQLAALAANEEALHKAVQALVEDAASIVTRLDGRAVLDRPTLARMRAALRRTGMDAAGPDLNGGASFTSREFEVYDATDDADDPAAEAGRPRTAAGQLKFRIVKGSGVAVTASATGAKRAVTAAAVRGVVQDHAELVAALAAATQESRSMTAELATLQSQFKSCEASAGVDADAVDAYLRQSQRKQLLDDIARVTAALEDANGRVARLAPLEAAAAPAMDAAMPLQAGAKRQREAEPQRVEHRIVEPGADQQEAVSKRARVEEVPVEAAEVVPPPVPDARSAAMSSIAAALARAVAAERGDDAPPRPSRAAAARTAAGMAELQQAAAAAPPAPKVVYLEEVPWQPPEGQTGDGRTALNAKYGY